MIGMQDSDLIPELYNLQTPSESILKYLIPKKALINNMSLVEEKNKKKQKNWVRNCVNQDSNC